MFCFGKYSKGPPKTFLPKLVFFSVTNQNFVENSHHRSETKIAKTSLTSTKYIRQNKKKRKKVSVCNVSIGIMTLWYHTYIPKSSPPEETNKTNT